MELLQNYSFVLAKYFYENFRTINSREFFIEETVSLFTLFIRRLGLFELKIKDLHTFNPLHTYNVEKLFFGPSTKKMKHPRLRTQRIRH